MSPDSICSFGISANITLNDLAVEVKRQSLLYGHKPNVVVGNYKDHVGNTDLFTSLGVRYVVFLWFFDALIPSLGVRASGLSESETEELCSSFTKEIRVILEHRNQFDKIFIPKMHKVRFGASVRAEREEARLLDTFHAIIDSECEGKGNVIVLDVSNIICQLGSAACIDERMYFLYKKPYREKFLHQFAADIFKEIRGHYRYYKKVLILDCDNTLWRGIIGEDGIYGIKLSPEDFPGNIYWYAQHFFLSLQKRGVLLAICSKNEGISVDEVFANHEFCLIKDEHLAIKKVNWRSKVANIKEIALELDLGLDSFVFLDDSDFECDAVRTSLPQVTVFQVPQKISDYPMVLKKISDLFPAESAEGKGNKTLEYRLRAQTRQAAAQWDSKEEYLRSLGTKVTIRKNESERIQRIAELTQKTNQFNLTTRRYSESEVLNLMKSNHTAVYSLYVSDKFGDSGLVGVCVLRYQENLANVDAFLLSCRVIGRGVEYAIWGHVCKGALELGVTEIRAKYIPTQKNQQVQNFFEELGFEVEFDGAEGKKYKRSIRSPVAMDDIEKKYYVEVVDDA